MIELGILCVSILGISFGIAVKYCFYAILIVLAIPLYEAIMEIVFG